MANMDPMQQEALKRAQEMQSRAFQQNQNKRSNTNEQSARQKNNHTNRNYNGFSSQHSGDSTGQINFSQDSKERGNKSQSSFISGKKNPPNEEASAQREKQPHISSGANNSRENKNMLDILMEDKERSLILLLILILSSEGANQSLILALMYLII